MTDSLPLAAPAARPESLLHAFDPRIKLVSALLLIVGVVLTPDRAYPAYPLLWALIASLALVGGIRPLRLARRGAIAIPFALAGITLLFTTTGTPLLTLGGLSISGAGVSRFAGILLKTWLAAQVSVLLTLTTPFTQVLWALEQLRVPAPLVQIIAMLYRYLFTLRDEADRLRAARAARSAALPGHPSGGRLVWRARVAGSMIGSLFLRSVERSERVYAAMLARGFDGKLHAAAPPPLHPRAVVVGLVPVAAAAAIQLMALLWWSRP